MNKIESLTPEQEKKLIAFREEWLKIGLATGPADLETIRPTINNFYQRIGKDAPYLWRCKSPMTANLIINVLRANLGANLRANRIKYINTWLWGSLDSFWVAYYLFPHLHLRSVHTMAQMEILSGWETLSKNAFWWYPFDGVCFVCDRPDFIGKDTETRLHDENRAAVEFSDGWKMWYWHGVEVPEQVITTPETLTVTQIQQEQNAEIRRVMLERMGWDKYLSQSSAELIHADGYGDLYRAAIPGDEPLVMVKLINSTPEPDGTYKPYLLRVPPDTQTAEAAVAWLGGFEVGEYEYLSQS